MFKVYWTESSEVKAEEFTEIDKALAFCEVKRKQQKTDKNICHIVLSVENPNDVTKKGVDVVDSTYDWKKRRR